MKSKIRVKSQIERDLENLEYRKRYEAGYEAFKLEVQILNALEEKGWSFTKLARVMHTSKSNISRDLSGGGIRSATVSRLAKMGEALGLKFLPLFVPEKREKSVVHKIHRLLAV